MTHAPAACAERAAFLRAIAEEHAEDTPRLAFADWLDEHGDARDVARAELIRVQVELAKLPPKPRKLFVMDGAGTMLEGLGVALIPRGDGHYSASNLERGLSIETFSPGERVDIYAHLARKDRVGWIRGLKYVRHVPERHEIIFRKDDRSGPWVGEPLSARESALLDAHGYGWCDMPGYKTLGVEKDGATVSVHFSRGAEPCVPVRHHFERGFIERVTVPTLAELVSERIVSNADDKGGERVTVPSALLRGIVGAVAGSPPERGLVREVVPLDREPTKIDEDRYGWYCEGRHESQPLALLPAVLWELLSGHLGGFAGKLYDSRELAVTALARALAQFGRTP